MRTMMEWHSTRDPKRVARDTIENPSLLVTRVLGHEGDSTITDVDEAGIKPSASRWHRRSRRQCLHTYIHAVLQGGGKGEPSQLFGSNARGCVRYLA